MRVIDPSTIPHAEAHRYLLTCVAPRPIAFVGTLDAEGVPNLAPFSFFNAFGANPPVIAFSPAYRGIDGTPKHTFLNIKETGEFTVSVVSYSMVEQVSLASGDYEAGVDEFVKAGFTKLKSEKIKPFGVAESPMVMECKLLQHVDLGGKPASGNLMIGEVVMFHIKESVFEGRYPEINRLDLVGRMGGPFYTRASGNAIFELAKPKHPGIGFDALSEEVRTSRVLTGNDLAILAGVETIPTREEAVAFLRERKASSEGMPDDMGIEQRVGNPDGMLAIALCETPESPDVRQDLFHNIAQLYLRRRDMTSAWYALLAPSILDEL